MKPLVDWWRDAGLGPAPQRPVLVVVAVDDDEAVSHLPAGYGASWQAQGTATGRVAEYLQVPVVGLGDDVPDHDILLLGEVGRGVTSLCARLAVGMYGAEAQLVVGRGSGICDLEWMDKVGQVRDTPLADPPPAVTGAAELIAAASVPVLLDGVLTAAAAAVSEVRGHVQAPTGGEEPAQRFLLERADVPSWGLSGIGPGEGLGALGGLATLRLALLAAG